MAKIKIKLGENEIEIDSRDFYVDNQSLGEVIESISKHIPENSAKVVYENPSAQTRPEPVYQETAPVYDAETQPSYDGLASLENAEVFEPEFDAPTYVASHEIKSKLKILQTASFFDKPRSVAETIQKLSEYGWTASPLDVSKTLAKMAINCEMTKSSNENKSHYSIKNKVIAS